VTKSHRNAFLRVFPTKELFKGRARIAVLWAALSPVLLGLLLFGFYFVADLLTAQGVVELSGDEIAEYNALTGQDIDHQTTQSRKLRIENQGAAATVWHARNQFWVTPAAALVRQVPPLRDNSTALILLVASVALIGFLRSLVLSRAKNVALRVGFDVATRLRQTLHRQTLRLGPSDLEERDSDHVLRLFTVEVDKVRDGVFQTVSRLGRYPVEVGLLLAVAASVHWLLALQCLVPMAACWYLVQREHLRFDSARRLEESRAEAELQLLAENLRKTRLVRGYGMEKFEHEQFQKHLERFRDQVASLKLDEGWSRWACRFLVMTTATIVLYLIGSRILTPGNSLALSDALLMLAAFVGLHRPLQGLWELHAEREAAEHSAELIYRYLNAIPEVGQAVGAKFLEPTSKSIQFEAVSYTSPSGRKLLDGLDLKLPAGKVTAVVAFDPLEARALAYLLPRFIEPQSGRVLFDGNDIAWVTLDSLRAETIYVGGTDPLFTGTVLENISGGDAGYRLQDVTAAAKESHAHNFIQKLPQGYETALGLHGEDLDPGQIFRLGLARAIVRDPAIMIIEEPAANMDEGTKSLLDDAYNRILRNRTVLFLPTRLSTLRKADHIVLLHKGRVQALGPHWKLVKSSHLYRHWEYMRFNELRHEFELVE
jgi:ATP-binding cassette, subfamily B, bacterial